MGGKKSGRKVDCKKAAAAEEKKRAKAKARKPLNPRQSRFEIAYVKTRSLKKAALAAGYSPKNPTQSGRQALAVIKEKAPEVMNRLGLTLETIIHKYLTPLLEAEETKFAQFEGEFTDAVEVDALSIRLGAVRTALEIHGAIGAGAVAVLEEGRRAGVDVYVIDIPRPGDGYASDDAINVTPVKPESNGNKPKNEIPPEDPRPKD
jgi:Terminase small subunit